MAILLFLNLKGGVAKTTTAVAVAESLACRGKKVLMIDADHQCATGELLLGEPRLNQAEKYQRTLHDFLAAMLDDEFELKGVAKYIANDASDIRSARPNLSVLPCSVRIDDFQTNMAKAKRGFQTNEEFQRLWRKRRSGFKRWLERTFEHTIVDCPPSLAPQVRFLLRVADGFILPSIPDRISVRGSLWLQAKMEKEPSPPPCIGTVWTLYREQNERHRNIVELGRKRAGVFAKLPKPFSTVVPNATEIIRALEGGQEFASMSGKYGTRFARIFDSLTDEIVKRIETQRTGPGRAGAGRPGTGANGG